MKKMIKKFIPKFYYQKSRAIYSHLKDIWYATIYYRKPRIFCISMQRNGTTSVGQFLKIHGYRVAGYGKHSTHWSQLWLKGDYDKIFHSLTFRSYQAYEDNPWWAPDFYRVLNNKFPKAKFILFYRDPDKWFNSMLNHSNGQIPGNIYGHCKVYRRLDEFYEQLDMHSNLHPSDYETDSLTPLEDKRDHYIKVYKEYNREVIEYFKKYGPEKLFVCRLENKNKWKKLGEFLGFHVPEAFNIHLNQSSKQEVKI